MKIWSSMLVGLLIVGLAGVAMAAEGGKKKGEKKAFEGRQGVFAKLDVVKAGDKEVTNVVIKSKASKEAEAVDVVVPTDASTTVKIDGADGKLSDLKEGMYLRIMPKEGTATTIEARAGGGKKKEGEKKAE